MRKNENSINHSLSNAVPQSAVLQFPGIFFMIIYWIFTSNESYYTSECIDLLLWSEILLYITAIGFFLSLGFLPILWITSYSIVVLFNGLAMFYVGFSFVYFFACISVFVGICYAYSENEDCGDLRWLNLAYIIIYTIEITLIIIWIIIVITCTIIKAKRIKKPKRNKEKSPEKNERYDELNEEEEKN